MESNNLNHVFIAAAMIVLIVGAFAGGLLLGWVLPKSNSTTLAPVQTQMAAIDQQATPNPESTATQEPLNELFSPFWQTWELVHNQYVDQPVDDTQLMQGAIRGMLDSLGDQHTSYMDPDEYEQMNAPLVGEYDGIGAWVDTTTEYLTIVSPMPDSPAEKAGLKAGDQILAVDGEDMTGIDANLVLRKVLGKAGTDVTLTISREGESEPFDVTITRETITLTSVESKMLDNGIAYINLTTFGETTDDELKTALKDLLAQNPKGLILDLRNNGGGYLDTAIDVVSEFIPGGKTVMYEQFGDGTRKTYTAKSGGLATDIPLVVLVNEGTASASEITAGAIQDYGRGTLVGKTTYGKGSVQLVTDLENDQGAVRVTVAHWLTPKERLIHKIGLTPDYEVELTEEDYKAGKDPQLDKAIELLTQQ